MSWLVDAPVRIDRRAIQQVGDVLRARIADIVVAPKTFQVGAVKKGVIEIKQDKLEYHSGGPFRTSPAPVCDDDGSVCN